MSPQNLEKYQKILGENKRSFEKENFWFYVISLILIVLLHSGLFPNFNVNKFAIAYLLFIVLALDARIKKILDILAWESDSR